MLHLDLQWVSYCKLLPFNKLTLKALTYWRINPIVNYVILISSYNIKNNYQTHRTSIWVYLFWKYGDILIEWIWTAYVTPLHPRVSWCAGRQLTLLEY